MTKQDREKLVKGLADSMEAIGLEAKETENDTCGLLIAEVDHEDETGSSASLMIGRKLDITRALIMAMGKEKDIADVILSAAQSYAVMKPLIEALRAQNRNEDLDTLLGIINKN